MTRTAAHPLRVVVPPRGSTRTLEIVWDLSGRAGADLASRRALAEPVAAVALRIESGPRRCEARAVAIGRSGARTPLDAARRCEVRWSREGDLEHVDAAGLLRCTLRGNDDRPLFARSSLPADLGLAPGTYSVRAASLGGE